MHSQGVFGQNATYSFKSSVSADSILIGDQVDLMIEAKLPPGYLVHFPIFADTLITGIEILGQPTIDTLESEGDVRSFLYKVKITSFDQGYYRIPPIGLPFGKGSTTDTAKTAPIWFLVNTLPPDSTIASIYDIKLPIAEPITFAEVAPWIFGGLLLIGLVVLAIYIISRYRKGEPIFNLKPADPPHIVALRELEQIKNDKLWESDDAKHFQSELTDIVRTYIEGQFGIPAMEQTTIETIGSLRKGKHIDSRLLEKLNDALSLADLTKFAKFSPDASENLSSLEFGFHFVNSTKPVEEKEEETEQNPMPENDNSINQNQQVEQSKLENQ